MLLKHIANIGELFEIKLKEGCTRTKLQDFLGDEEFAVFQPSYNGLPFWPERDQKLSFVFYRHNGAYTFDAQIVETYDEDSLRLCRFKQISEVVKHQRREAYRLPVVLDVVIEEHTNGEPIGDSRLCKGKTVNLSEKSVQLTCFKQIPVKTKVSVTIYFDKMISIVLPAETIRCTKPMKKSEPYEVVLLFTECSDKDMTYIRKYILQRQIDAKLGKNDLINYDF